MGVIASSRSSAQQDQRNSQHDMVIDDLLEACDEMELDCRDELSPSSSESWWYSSKCKELPDGRVPESELVYVQLGCSAGSLNSRAFFISSVAGTLRKVFCED